MALDNEIVLMGLAGMFIYFVLYRKNSFFGNVGFFCLGLAIMSFNTGNLYAVAGFVTMAGSIISLIYDILYRYYK